MQRNCGQCRMFWFQMAVVWAITVIINNLSICGPLMTPKEEKNISSVLVATLYDGAKRQLLASNAGSFDPAKIGKTQTVISSQHFDFTKEGPIKEQFPLDKWGDEEVAILRKVTKALKEGTPMKVEFHAKWRTENVDYFNQLPEILWTSRPEQMNEDDSRSLHFMRKVGDYEGVDQIQVIYLGKDNCMRRSYQEGEEEPNVEPFHVINLYVTVLDPSQVPRNPAPPGSGRVKIAVIILSVIVVVVVLVGSAIMVWRRRNRTTSQIKGRKLGGVEETGTV